MPMQKLSKSRGVDEKFRQPIALINAPSKLRPSFTTALVDQLFNLGVNNLLSGLGFILGNTILAASGQNFDYALMGITAFILPLIIFIPSWKPIQQFIQRLLERLRIYRDMPSLHLTFSWHMISLPALSLL
jgi:hypothetical protein